MSRKTGRNKRLQLYDRGNTACPICLSAFTRNRTSAGRTVTLEHVPPKSLGGQARCLTCKRCNAAAGHAIDQAAAVAVQTRFPVTVDIMGKRDTFILSPDGKALTPPFAGYSKRDLQMLQNSPSRQFTMSVKIPSPAGVAASALKAAYLALFSLLGPGDGYDYIRGDGLLPVRRIIVDPLGDHPIRSYVWEAPTETPDSDILLISQPVPCWVVKIANQLVNLPLAGHSPGGAPLWLWHKLTGSDRAVIVGHASWTFQTFGALRAVHVHLPGADEMESLIGRIITGTLPNTQRLRGTCVRHEGESAILLCNVRTVPDVASSRKSAPP